ncbi:MAG TPA: hypothetical protein DCO72_07290 [Ruminococcus sp.]|nr:hypothetical protein [Ruminococcus sp.]
MAVMQAIQKLLKLHHVFSAVFCLVLSVSLILGIMKNHKLRIIATILGITSGLLAWLIPYLLNNQSQNHKNKGLP